MPQLLFIGSVWPEPSASAGGSRTEQLLRLLSQAGYEIVFASAAAENEHSLDLSSLGIRKVAIEINHSSFDAFLTALLPDVVIFDRFMTEEQFGWRIEQTCPQALRVIDTIDLHCLREARRLATQSAREINHQDKHNEIALREIASILRCDLSIMISKAEIDLLTEFYKIDQRLLHYTPFLLDIDTITNLSQSWPAHEKRQHFITIGNFLHAPNWDAVQYLKTEIWPRIHEQLPETELHVYGAYTPKKAQQLHQPKQGFHILGRADSVATVMREARVCLAPLRFGAGLKGKLLDAMQHGTPSVTSDIGAEGMHADLDWCGVIENDPKGVAWAAVELYQNSKLWEEKQQQGLKIIRHCFDQKEYGPRLLNRIAELRENLDQHRQENFLGTMLRHHSNKSTMYMAKWIEAKNNASSQ